jgi:5-methylcytosine-specific restriction endonuclease McrA
LLVKQRRRCANCRCKISEETMHRDHIVALSRGGSNSMSNIQLLCAPCNRKKYNKDPLVFAREQGRLL